MKIVAFYLLLRFSFTKYNAVSSQTILDEAAVNVLNGPNVCKRLEEYVSTRKMQSLNEYYFKWNWNQIVILSSCNRFPVEVVVTEKQPYQERSNNFCFAFPPRCSTYKIKFRTVNKTQILMKSRLVYECCGNWNFHWVFIINIFEEWIQFFR